MVEGVRAVEELLASSLRIRGALVAPQLDGAPRGAALHAELRRASKERTFELVEIEEQEFRDAAATDSPQGVLVIAKIPEHSFETIETVLGGGESSDEMSGHVGADRVATDTSRALRLLVLDGVQDPGNVGTIIRTAAALGVSGTIALPGTVDLWNAKVVRGAMGAHFRHPAFHVSVEELRAYLSEHRIPLWAADARGESLDMLRATFPPASRLAIAVGNEGAGISPEIAEFAERTVALPIQDVESLNVAVATGILLYELRTTAAVLPPNLRAQR